MSEQQPLMQQQQQQSQQQPLMQQQQQQPMYAAAPPPQQQTNVIVQQEKRTPVPCIDDNNPIGTFGCDKRAPANCCVKCFCAPCTYTNYEGMTCCAIFTWVFMWSVWVSCFVACCWQEKLMGVHYGKKQIIIQNGQVQQPVMVVNAGEDEEDSGDEYDS